MLWGFNSLLALKINRFKFLDYFSDNINNIHFIIKCLLVISNNMKLITSLSVGRIDIKNISELTEWKNSLKILCAHILIHHHHCPSSCLSHTTLDSSILLRECECAEVNLRLLQQSLQICWTHHKLHQRSTVSINRQRTLSIALNLCFKATDMYRLNVYFHDNFL